MTLCTYGSLRKDVRVYQFQDDDCDVQEVAIPSHGEVLDMLSKCLPWVEQQTETSAAHLFMYKNLIEMAAAKRSSSLRQSKITSFFS